MQDPVNLVDPQGLEGYATSLGGIGTVVGAYIGGAGATGAVVGSGGVLIPASPEVIGLGIEGGAIVGGAAGHTLGTLIDNVVTDNNTYSNRGERRQDKGRSDDPYSNYSTDELQSVLNDPKSTPSQKARAKKLNQKKKNNQTGKKKKC